MKRVAIVTYWYPPMRTVASVRLAKFAKYLPAFGWEPFVFTITPGSTRYTRAGALTDATPDDHVFRTSDPSLHTKIDRLRSRHDDARAKGSAADTSLRGTVLGRVAYRVYREALCFPDETWPWLLQRRTIVAAARAVAPDVVFSSSPPATSHLIASAIARDLRKPWVADFRDPWSQTHTLPRFAPLRAVESIVERRTIRRASALTTVTNAMADQLASFHRKPVFVVHNGFDDEVQSRQADAPADERRFTLVHTGILYERTRTPAVLFDALSGLVARGDIDPREIVIRFYGRNLDIAARELARRPAIAPSVELCGEVSYGDSLTVQQRATALLLLEWTDARASGVLTGKIFEYFAAGRPILAIGPRGGEIDRLLARTKRGSLAADASEAAKLLLAAVKQFRASGTLACDTGGESIDQFSRRALTGRLAGVFDTVAR